MALLHKDLKFETVAWRFTDKKVIAPGGSSRVPVVLDGDQWVSDSWKIALYLDETYPEAPLMDGEAGRGLCHFVNSWCDMSLNKALRPLALLQVFAVAHEKDKSYFRESREATLGTTLEQACTDPAAARAALHDVLAPAETALSERAYLAGDAPIYADYALFGSLKWIHTLSGDVPLAADSAVQHWFERMLDLFDGYARNAPSARV